MLPTWIYRTSQNHLIWRVWWKSPEVTKKVKQKSLDSSSPILTQQELSTWNPPTLHRFQSPTEKRFGDSLHKFAFTEDARYNSNNQFGKKHMGLKNLWFIRFHHPHPEADQKELRVPSRVILFRRLLPLRFSVTPKRIPYSPPGGRWRYTWRHLQSSFESSIVNHFVNPLSC